MRGGPKQKKDFKGRDGFEFKQEIETTNEVLYCNLLNFHRSKLVSNTLLITKWKYNGEFLS